MGRPGDALYIPSGVECWAVGNAPEEPVLYVLLTLQSNSHSFEMSMGKYLTDILREGDFSKDADLFFRSAVTKQSIPPRATAGAKDHPAHAELEARSRRCAAELASLLSAKG